jgi:hypothetical protein
MNRRIARLALPLGLGLAGCPSEEAGSEASPSTSAPASAPAPEGRTSTTAARGTTPETRDYTDPDGVVRRGEAVAHEEAMTVTAVLKDAEALAGQQITITGEVTRVCKKKGCWMALRGGEGGPGVRVTFDDYAYFVPRTSVGMTATVKGELSVKVLDEATARHYAEDAKAAGEPPPDVEAGIRELRVASVGLELRPS